MKKHKVTVFCLDDQELHIDALHKAFKSIKEFSIDFIGFQTPEIFMKTVEKGPLPTFVILDIDLNHEKLDGLDVAKNLRDKYHSLIIFMYSSHANESKYQIRANEIGVHGLIPKQIPDELKVLKVCEIYTAGMIEKVLKIKRLQLKQKDTKVIGNSLKSLQNSIPGFLESPFSSSIFISGEKGTGKSFFLSLFYEAIPDGIRKAYIRGPIKFKKEIDLAIGGWLIIDGLDNIPVDLQGYLFGLLADRRIRVLVAETHPSPTQINTDLLRLLRMNRVNIPPLRNRPNEIPLFINHFQSTSSENHIIDQDAKNALYSYDYRQDNIVQVLAVLNQSKQNAIGNSIHRMDLPEEVRNYKAIKNSEAKIELTEIIIKVDLDNIKFKDATNLLLLELIKRISEKNKRVRKKTNSNVISEQISFSRSTLVERITEMGISEEELNFIYNQGD